MMKKKIISVCSIFTAFFLLFSLMPNQASASNQVDITGGVKNEYDYIEYVFLSGEPVKFTGADKNVKVTTKTSKGKQTTNYTYSLKSEAGDTLTRKITYVEDVKEYSLIGQTVQNGSVTSASEVIKINGVTYTLLDYQFSNGLTTDNRPAADYYAGNIVATKTYEKKAGKTIERVVVNISSKNEGYSNYWGASETQITTQEIQFADGTVGLVENRLSSNKSKTLNYQENNASLSSFTGGYVTNSAATMVSQYKYNFGEGEEVISTQIDHTPVIQRLPIPKFKDTANHYAREEIERLYSLGIYEEDLEYFNPDLKMQRYEFTISVSKAINLRVLEEALPKDTTTRLFSDVSRYEKDYQYLVAAYNKGIIKGISATDFDPIGGLTREQAATILIRALGLEGKLQDSQVLSKYYDQYYISDYAKTAVIEATKIGLMQGDNYGNFRPYDVLSRADAAIVVTRFLQYLNKDLTENYRDNILFY